MTSVLEVRELRVRFPGRAAPAWPVDGVDFTLERGEMLALVGESGSGKSLTSLALLRLVPAPGTITSDSSIRLGEIDVMSLDGDALRRIRGRRIGLVMQDALGSLNPVLTIGDQLCETIRTHFPLSRSAARARAEALLAEVALPDPARRLTSYPHQLSGGQRQRVLLALALAGEPEVLIADEPTSSLDVTVQAQILALIDHLRASRGMAVLLITHDLAIVAGRADRVAVMYAGRIVETGATRTVFATPGHPYTRGLLDSLPRLRGPVRLVEPIGGSVPSPDDWPAGCRFHPRCPRRMPACTSQPPVVPVAPGHTMRCWLPRTAP
ncbi:MAG: ABC transporter ATP-binding protein [Gemmatimonadales bacterium]